MNFQLLNIVLLYLLCKVSTSPLALEEDVGEPLYLTPYIQNGQIEEAQQAARVNLDGAKNTTSYSGFFTVNEKYNSNLFFWYFVSETDPETAPVLVWLNGGPGTSSLMGLFQEHGPFYITSDLTLKYREYYWTKNHHVIYIESPVGTGYSYTTKTKGYSKNTKEVGVNLHEALVQFFEMFPNLKKNPLYLTGESYGGKYVPALSNVILTKEKITNFRGVAIGNGLTDPVTQSRGFGDFLYQQGFIDTQQRQDFREYEKQCSNNIKKLNYATALLYCRSIIDPFTVNTIFKNYTGYVYTYNILQDIEPKDDIINREKFIQLPATRRAIHVGNAKRYKDPETIQAYLGVSLFESEKEHVEDLLNANYPVLIYNGQLDIQIPYIITIDYVKTLEFGFAEEYKIAPRHIWMVDGHVAGYVKQAGSLTEVMVIGAGHAVPTDQPRHAFDLITKFTHMQPLY